MALVVPASTQCSSGLCARVKSKDQMTARFSAQTLRMRARRMAQRTMIGTARVHTMITRRQPNDIHGFIGQIPAGSVKFTLKKFVVTGCTEHNEDIRAT